jgi:hypothetical protein
LAKPQAEQILARHPGGPVEEPKHCRERYRTLGEFEEARRHTLFGKHTPQRAIADGVAHLPERPKASNAGERHVPHQALCQSSLTMAVLDQKTSITNATETRLFRLFYWIFRRK